MTSTAATTPDFSAPPPAAKTAKAAKATLAATAVAKPAPHPTYDGTRYPVSIFGKLPAGFVLQDQSIFMLRHWQSKALAAASAATDDAGIARTMPVANELNDAIKAYKSKNASDVAQQMAAVVDWFRHMGDATPIEEQLSVAEFRHFAELLTAATAPIQPTKKLGPLNKGGKLTRAGLLFRYQSFLAQELLTLSWTLYGQPQYASHMIYFDHEVTKRCSEHFKDGKLKPHRSGKSYPFFDESKLSARARGVLGALKIDRENADKDLMARGRNRGAR